MNNSLAVLLMLGLTGSANAQSTVTLESLDLGGDIVAGANAGPTEMETCLLDQDACTNPEFKTSAGISLDDVVNLGVIDHSEAEAVKAASSATGGAVIDTAKALPSIDMEILFDYDSAELRDDQFHKLRELASVLRGDDFRAYSVVFLGYTDAQGSVGYNQELSSRRARVVSNFVRINADIPDTNVRTKGLGSQELKDQANPFSEKNRRVRVVLIPRG